jgi:hypothetical protein
MQEAIISASAQKPTNYRKTRTLGADRQTAAVGGEGYNATGIEHCDTPA